MPVHTPPKTVTAIRNNPKTNLPAMSATATTTKRTGI
jgi:hypothetical protein